MIWTGRVLSAIPVLLFVVGGSFSFKPSPQMLEGMGKFGWQESSLPLIATLEICCAVLYIIPRTAVLGAIPKKAARAVIFKNAIAHAVVTNQERDGIILGKWRRRAKAE